MAARRPRRSQWRRFVHRLFRGDTFRSLERYIRENKPQRDVPPAPRPRCDGGVSVEARERRSRPRDAVSRAERSFVRARLRRRVRGRVPRPDRHHETGRRRRDARRDPGSRRTLRADRGTAHAPRRGSRDTAAGGIESRRERASIARARRASRARPRREPTGKLPVADERRRDDAQGGETPVRARRRRLGPDGRVRRRAERRV